MGHLTSIFLFRYHFSIIMMAKKGLPISKGVCMDQTTPTDSQQRVSVEEFAKLVGVSPEFIKQELELASGQNTVLMEQLRDRVLHYLDVTLPLS
jgi:hypothetical protein